MRLMQSREISRTKTSIRVGVTLGIILIFATAMKGQFADPALTKAIYRTAEPLPDGTAKSELVVSVGNVGSTIIPANSVEVVFSFPCTWFKTDGLSLPAGLGSSLFQTWTFVDIEGGHQWRGTNNKEMGASVQRDIIFEVFGVQETVAPELTSINIQPVSKFTAFLNEPSNDNLQPAHEISRMDETSVGFILDQNSPNPFSESTNIGFEIPRSGIVRVSLYDAAGKSVLTKSTEYGPGYHQMTIHKSELANASGMLSYKVTFDPSDGGGVFTHFRKMILVNKCYNLEKGDKA